MFGKLNIQRLDDNFRRLRIMVVPEMG